MKTLKRFFNHEMHQVTQKEEGDAGMPGAKAGGVFAGPLASKLDDGG